MSTKCEWKNQFQRFYSTPMFVSAGVLSTNYDADSTTEEVIFTETINASTFDSTSMHFKLTLAGTISSDGTDDVTLRLRYGTTDILETIVTTALPDEDDKCFVCEYFGRIHTTGATGKVVAQGRLMNEMTGMADVLKTTAAAGVTVDLTAAGSINVTSQWDNDDATTDIVLTYAVLELFS